MIVASDLAHRVLPLVAKARKTGQVAETAREDVVKVLTLLRDYDGAALIRDLSDETYGAIVASARGPAVGPLTPPGRLIDPDEPPPRGSG